MSPLNAFVRISRHTALVLGVVEALGGGAS